MMLLAPLSLAIMYRPGYCAATKSNRGCDATQRMGSWPIPAHTWSSSVHRCYERCAACAVCRHFSVSVRWRDCSWFSECNSSNLLSQITGFRTFSMVDLPRSLSQQDFEHAVIDHRVAHDDGAPLCEYVDARAGATRWRMCVYAKGRDVDISDSIRSVGCYECDMVKRVLATLQREEEHQPKLVDIGGSAPSETRTPVPDGPGDSARLRCYRYRHVHPRRCGRWFLGRCL